MGEDKDENDLLIRYGFPEDIWYAQEMKHKTFLLFKTSKRPFSPPERSTVGVIQVLKDRQWTDKQTLMCFICFG